MKPKSIEPGKPHLKYTLETARDAVNQFNRMEGFMSTPLVSQQPTAADIVEPPRGALHQGNLNAYVIFITQGLKYLDDRIEIKDVEPLLGYYIRPKEQNGKGGDLADFLPDIRDALLKCGVVRPKSEEGEEGADVDPPADQREAAD